ncbi:MAG: glycosyltransferase family 4 protein [Patescibacteria group bacterium]|jgi:phosphatidylinositol alpha-1,6-mannosyltransferase
MKTLLFTLEYPPFHGGVANYYGNLVKYWPSFAKASTDAKALADKSEGKPKPDEISVLDNKDGRLINNKLPLLKWLPAYFALRREIKQEKIEHILVGQILPLGAAALICAKFFKIKYSVFLHGMDLTYALKKPRKKWLAKKILSNTHKIICLNGYTANLTKQFFPLSADKIAVVNPAIEPARPAAPEKISALKKQYNLTDKIILLSVGRLVKRKGFDKVIEALPEALRQAPNLIYIILGGGAELKNLKFQISNLGLEKQVIIINQATDKERDNWYNASDIFIMPSRNINGDFEGFGLVYLEANLAGKPVIAGKSGGVGDAVIAGLNGLLVDPEDTEQIASAIIKLARDPGLRKKLGEQGRERAIKEFNWEKQIKKIYKAITFSHCHCEKRSDEAISG